MNRPDKLKHQSSEQGPKPAKLEVYKHFTGADYVYKFRLFTSTSEQTAAYNAAIEKVMRAHDYDPFHELGDNDEPGIHIWESFGVKGPNELEVLLPEIQAEVEKQLGQLAA